MSKNIFQIFSTNPATSMQGTDLLYLGRSPYGVGDDFGITWTNVLASITAGGAGGANTQIQYNNSGALAGDTGFTTDGAGNETIVGSLKVDNLELNGNTISSSTGSINLVPALNVNLLTSSDTSSIIPTGYNVIIAKENAQTSTFIGSFSNDTVASELLFLKSRSTTFGGSGPVTTGDDLGTLNFNGDDGFGYDTPGALIAAETGFGSVSNGAIPGVLNFYTNNSTGTGLSTAALSINETQNVVASKNIYARTFGPSFTNTASAGGNTILTLDSTQIQQITGTLTQTITMPDVSTFPIGTSFQYIIINNSTLAVTVNSSGGNLIATMAANTTLLIWSIANTGTTAAAWNASYITDSGASGIVSPGTINQLAVYAATGSTVSGLATANSGVLVTSGAGVPSISTTLPTGLALSTPASGTLSSCSGLPISTGVSGLGTGVATFLGTPSSANLAAALTDEVGSGFAVFSNSSTYTPVITFGGGSTGITYGFQTGFYTITGRICTFTGSVTLTNKGSSTGAAAISIPNVSRTSAAQLITIASANLTFAGSLYSQINSATSVALINTFVTGGAMASVTDTGFTNTTTITVSGTYLI